MSNVLVHVWQNSWQAAIVALLVLVMRAMFGRVLTRRRCHALWILVLLRLALPVLPGSPVSLFEIVHRFWQQTPPRAAEQSDLKWTVLYGPMSNTRAPAIADQPRQTSTQTNRQAPVDLLSFTWLAGVALFAARAIYGNAVFMRRLRRRPAADADEPTRQLFRDCCNAMRLRRPPQLLMTDAITSPAVAGLFRPRVLLPVGLTADLTTEQLRLVLLHELAHVRCRDVAVDWLWAAVQAMHWFNPIVWLIRPLRHADREQARDEMVLSIVGARQAECYGRTILGFVQSARPIRLYPGLIGILNKRAGLGKRIEMIARFQQRSLVLRLLGLTMFIAVGCIALTNPPTTHAQAQTPAPGNTIATPPSTRPAISPAAEPNESAADAVVRDKLDRRMNALNFDKVPFADVIDFFRQSMDLNIYVDWPGLERASIKRDAPVTARLRDIRFSKALELIFKCVEGDEDDRKIGYVIDDGVLTISTHRELNKNVVTERYDINDLLFVAPDYSNAPPSTTAPTADEQHNLRQQRIEELKKFIVDNVATTSWKINGGEVGSISSSPLRAMLLITQTPSNHRAIHQLLDSLRESQSRQISVESRLFLLDDAAERALSDNLRQHLTAAARADKDSSTNVLPAAQVDELIRVIRKWQGATSLTAPRLTLFSGQRAVLSVSTSTTYIASMSANVKTTGNSVVTTYEPQNSNVTGTGIKVDVMATVAPDNRGVYVDFHPVLAQLDRLDSVPWAGAPADAHVFVQKPIVSTCELRTSCTIPDGASVVLGGFSQSTPATADAAVQNDVERPTTNPDAMASLVSASRSGRLYWLIKPTILPHVK
ncbi:MAG TPA: M56 family metallopeptidase [Tepidisphaeraceae bacterium]|nr:M56 family metallopeptidase [Tepidisphaeraceae bacterium]